MTLDDLPWRRHAQPNTLVAKLKFDGRHVFIFNWGDAYSIYAYDLVDGMRFEQTKWDDIDALTAQCVLNELVKELPAGVTPTPV